MLICQGEGPQCQCIPEKLIKSLVRKNRLVEELDFQSFNIKHIKNIKFAKETLLKINLANNSINDIKSISELLSLQILDVTFNQITSLQPINALSQLIELRASGNQIEETNFFLPKLQIMDLSYNKISNLNSLTLQKYSNLKSVSLRGNQLKDYNQQIIDNYENIFIVDGIQIRQDEVQFTAQKNQIINLQEKQLQQKMGCDQLLQIWRKELYKQMIYSKSQSITMKKQFNEIKNLFLKLIQQSINLLQQKYVFLNQTLIQKIVKINKVINLIKRKDSNYKTLLFKIYGSLQSFLIDENSHQVSYPEQLIDGQIIMAQIRKIKSDYEEIKKLSKQSQTQLEIEKQQNIFLRDQVKESEDRIAQSREQLLQMEKVYQAQEIEKNRQIFQLQSQIKQLHEEKLQIIRSQKDLQNQGEISIFTTKQKYEQEIQQLNQDIEILNLKLNSQQEEVKNRIQKITQKNEQRILEIEQKYREIIEESKQEFENQINLRAKNEEKLTKDILILKSQIREQQLQNNSQLSSINQTLLDVKHEKDFIERELTLQIDNLKAKIIEQNKDFDLKLQNEKAQLQEHLVFNFEQEKNDLIQVLQNQHLSQISELEAQIQEEKKSNKQTQVQNVDLMKIIGLKDEIIKQQAISLQCQPKQLNQEDQNSNKKQMTYQIQQKPRVFQMEQSNQNEQNSIKPQLKYQQLKDDMNQKKNIQINGVQQTLKRTQDLERKVMEMLNSESD